MGFFLKGVALICAAFGLGWVIDALWFWESRPVDWPKVGAGFLAIITSMQVLAVVKLFKLSGD